MLRISGKLQGIDTVTARFRNLPKVVDRATASALNKLGAKGVTAAKKGITDVYNIKSGDVGKAIMRIPAKASYGGRQERLFTVLKVKGGRIGLHKFGGLPSAPVSQKGIPISKRRDPTVKILKGASRRKVTRDMRGGTGNKPFVAMMKSGFRGSETNHAGIFVRTDKWSFSSGKKQRHEVIRELKSKGIAESFLAHGRDQLDRMIAENGLATVQRELEYYLSKKK